MAWNSITSQGASIRWPTHLQKRHPVESWGQWASSPATNISPRYATKGQNGPTMAHLIQPQGLTNRRLTPAPRSWSLKRNQR
jgi:hypothetical protein